MINNFVLTVDITQNKIYQFDLANGRNASAIDLPPSAKPTFATYDGKSQLYWVDKNSQQILRSNLRGNNTSIIHTLGMIQLIFRSKNMYLKESLTRSSTVI